jgi:hypothetical protein
MPDSAGPPGQHVHQWRSQPGPRLQRCVSAGPGRCRRHVAAGPSDSHVHQQAGGCAPALLLDHTQSHLTSLQLTTALICAAYHHQHQHLAHCLRRFILPSMASSSSVSCTTDCWHLAQVHQPCHAVYVQTLKGLASATFNGSSGSYLSALPMWAFAFNRWVVPGAAVCDRT